VEVGDHENLDGVGLNLKHCKGIMMVECSSWLGRSISRLHYLIHYPELFLRAYDSGNPIALPMLGRYFVSFLKLIWRS
jgi:hypothetical protein